jgi:penicillin amidase
MIWTEMMIFDQSDQLRTELKNINMLASVGWDMYADLHPHYRDDRPVIIPSEELDYLEDVDESVVPEIGLETFRNATLGQSGIGVIEDIFNRGPYATNGSESVIQKTCWSANEPYEVDCIPALRQVIDLGDLSNSLMIHSVGQSGHPMHRYYDHFIDPWRNFEYHPSNWERGEAESGSSDTLILEPAG